MTRTKRSTGKKPSSELQGKLAESLSRLARSPRLDFVRTLNAAMLLGAPAASVPQLAKANVGQLVEMGPEKVLRLKGLTEENLTLLCSILDGLAGAANPFMEAPAAAGAPVIELVSHRTLAETLSPLAGKGDPDLLMVPDFSSSEAELKLIAALDALRKSPELPSFQHMKVADLWEPGWPSAPFEEAMTIRQVLQIDVENLLRKRSFRGKKLRFFITAMEKLAGRTQEKSAAPGMPEPPAPSAISAPFTPRWAAAVHKASSIEKAALIEFERASLLPSTLSPLLAEIVRTFTSDEWLTLWQAAERGTSAATELHERFAAAARAQLPTVVSAWESALAGAGVTYQQLTEPYRSQGAAEESIFSVLLSALGAKHPVIRGNVIELLWTKTPALLDLALKSAGNTLEITQIKELFPAFPDEVCRDIRQIIASGN